MEARVLEHLDPLVREQRAQVLAHRLDPEGRDPPPSAGRDGSRRGSRAAPALEQQLQRRQRRADARVVGDAPVLERDVQVGADEDGLPVDVRVANRARQPHSCGQRLEELDQVPGRVAQVARRGRPSPAGRPGPGRGARPCRAIAASTSSTSSTSSVESPGGRSSTTSPWPPRSKIATDARAGVERGVAARFVAGGDPEPERVAVEAECRREVVDEQPHLREPHQSSLPIRSTSRHE